MDLEHPKIRRPVALVILDGWGYAPRTEGNAIAIAHTPYYDAICRHFPMTTLAAAGDRVGQDADEAGNAEVGHLNMGTGRIAQTETARIKKALASGEFMQNEVINRALAKAKEDGSGVHFIGLISDGGIHSSTDSLFALLRLAKQCGLEDVYIHCILDGVDVAPRTADVYVEAVEIKLADIGIGRIATLCGRYFAMDSCQNWERTARAFTMLVHGEGEGTSDAVSSIRNSFLRGISDEFIAPIIVEQSPDVPVAKIANGDLVVFFNHRGDGMRQLVRSLCVPEGESGSKPEVETLCLTEYDAAFDLPAAYRQEPQKNSLTEVLSGLEIPNIKITETARFFHLTSFFDGFDPVHAEQQILVGAANPVPDMQPESQTFKITDALRKGLESSPDGVFVVNIPAAGLMAETGDLRKTVSAIQFIDTCIGGICEKVLEAGGVAMITSTHGNCEDMVHLSSGEANAQATVNPVPFHYVDDRTPGMKLKDGMSLEDVAPTILGVLDIEKPEEMTGTDIREI